MKKFLTVVPLQPVDWKNGAVVSDMLKEGVYEPVGNPALEYGATRFPIIPVINAYAEAGESIEVLAVLMGNGKPALHHLKQLEDEIDALKSQKGFECEIKRVPVNYAGDVGTMVQVFRSLLDYFDDGDKLYACMTYGNKPIPIAEFMAINYAYRVMKDVLIGCLVYGEMDHSTKPSALKIFDITALIHLDETVRLLADSGARDPLSIIDGLLELSKGGAD